MCHRQSRRHGPSAQAVWAIRMARRSGLTRSHPCNSCCRQTSPQHCSDQLLGGAWGGIKRLGHNSSGEPAAAFGGDKWCVLGTHVDLDLLSFTHLGSWHIDVEFSSVSSQKGNVCKILGTIVPTMKLVGLGSHVRDRIAPTWPSSAPLASRDWQTLDRDLPGPTQVERARLVQVHWTHATCPRQTEGWHAEGR